MAEKKETAKKATKKVEEKEVKKVPKKAEKTAKAEKPAKEAKVKLKKSEKKHSKKYREVVTLVERDKEYSVEEAIDLAKKTSTTKFDSSVEVHIKLNVDIRNSEQQVRGSVTLPAGTGKNKVVTAIVSPSKEKEAKDAGAENVGGEDLIAKIEKGWLDFDVVVATPDMMPKLGKIGKILGTKGLMPNPKTGTVTNDVAKVIKDIKKGMVEYRPDVTGIVHVTIGKVSFAEKDLQENYKTLLDAITKARPSGVKGTYIKGISIATTMGPGIKVQM
jgi:large subunit ribosomal protein L1